MGDQEHRHHGDGPAAAGCQHGHRLRTAGSGVHWQRTLNAPGQLQNRLTSQAPLIVQTNGTAYGQNDLSDEKVKQNIRDADLDELQAIFDRAAPKRYDGADVDQKDRLGFLAQDTCSTEALPERRCGKELLTLALWQADSRAVGRLQEAAGKGRRQSGAPARLLSLSQNHTFASVALSLTNLTPWAEVFKQNWNRSC